jgi:hypothetical protein
VGRLEVFGGIVRVELGQYVGSGLRLLCFERGMVESAFQSAGADRGGVLMYFMTSLSRGLALYKSSIHQNHQAKYCSQASDMR